MILSRIIQHILHTPLCAQGELDTAILVTMIISIPEFEACSESSIKDLVPFIALWYLQ
jgi:hypothetical protein